MSRYFKLISSGVVTVVAADDDYTAIGLIATTANDAQGIAKPAYEEVGYDDVAVTVVSHGVTGTTVTTAAKPAY
jgi:hypothetical protein